MEPKREQGDDRIMWKVTARLNHTWCVIEDTPNALDDLLTDSFGAYEVQRVRVTAEEWNAMPEWDGW